MRRRLVAVSLAVSSMVALAFVLPLGLLVREVARDRALSAAERDAAALAPVLAVSDDPALVDAAIARTASGSRGRVDIRRPGGDAAATVDVPGGQEVRLPVVLQGGTATIAVFVPDAELSHDVGRTWFILGVVAAALVAGSVAVADRLARPVVAPTRDLAAAAAALGAGDLDVRVPEVGPAELVEVAGAFNHLAGRIRHLLAAERELLADLSHRLRTPLTALRLDAEALGASDAAARVRADAARLEDAVTALIDDVRRERRPAGAADPAAVVAERAAFWSPLAEEQGRAWTVSIVPVPLVAVEAADLAAAVDALLGNVFAHTPDGTAVDIRVGVVSGQVQVTVGDAGPGLPSGAEVRGHSTGASTGLGLDIARRTAEDAGGALELGRSDALGGAAVSLRLPAAGVTPPAAPDPSGRGSPRSGS